MLYTLYNGSYWIYITTIKKLCFSIKNYKELALKQAWMHHFKNIHIIFSITHVNFIFARWLLLDIQVKKNNSSVIYSRGLCITDSNFNIISGGPGKRGGEPWRIIERTACTWTTTSLSIPQWIIRKMLSTKNYSFSCCVTKNSCLWKPVVLEHKFFWWLTTFAELCVTSTSICVTGIASKCPNMSFGIVMSNTDSIHIVFFYATIWIKKGIWIPILNRPHIRLKETFEENEADAQLSWPRSELLPQAL